MGQNKPDIILLWGDGLDLVIDLENHPTHHVNTLPLDLSRQMKEMDSNETSIKRIDQLQVPIESLGSAVGSAAPAEQVASETVSIAPPSQENEPVALQVAEERPVESETVSIAPPSQENKPVALQVAEERPVASETVSIAPTELAAPTEIDVDEGLYVREPVIPAPAPPVEESPQEPAVAFAGIVNDKPEVEAEEVKIDLPAEESEEEVKIELPAEEAEEEVKIELPAKEAEEAPAQEAPAEEAPVEEEQEVEAQKAQADENQENQENEEWNEEVNQIQAAQPSLPQQPPSEQQISRPPPPAS